MGTALTCDALAEQSCRLKRSAKDPVTDPIPAPRNTTPPIKYPRAYREINRRFRILLEQVTKPSHTVRQPTQSCPEQGRDPQSIMPTLHRAELLREPVVLTVLLSPQESKNRVDAQKHDEMLNTKPWQKWPSREMNACNFALYKLLSTTFVRALA